MSEPTCGVPVLRWILTSWLASWWHFDLTAQARSDIALHGYLLWSNIKPQKPTTNLPKRGLWCQIGDFLWPLPLRWIEQEQAGDTIPHTFLWPAWPPATTRWAMVFPSSDPTFRASTSPVWQLTSPPSPFWQLVISELWTT